MKLFASDELCDVVSRSLSYIDMMVEQSKKQGIINVRNLEELQRCLSEINLLILNDHPISSTVVTSWNTAYGNVFRWFEGLPIEKDIDRISEILNPGRY